MKYAIAADGGRYFDLTINATKRFVSLDRAPLYSSQEDVFRAVQNAVILLSDIFVTGMRLVRVDEVVHVGETKEVRRSYCAPVTDVAISTRYEINPHCLCLGRDFRYKAGTENGVLLVLTEPAYREICCGDFTVEAIDTTQLPPSTTRVASELK